jgi:hypothetical protein
MHYPDEGLAGAEQATITGLAFGTIFRYGGQPIHADVCARCVRSDRGCDYLLESRIENSPSRIPMMPMVLCSLRTPAAKAGRFEEDLLFHSVRFLCGQFKRGSPAKHSVSSVKKLNPCFGFSV